MSRSIAFVVLVFVTLAGLPAAALPAGTFGIGVDGVFSLTDTTNELSEEVEVENSTLFLRSGVRAEYYIIKNIPILFTAGLVSRSLDRGDASSSENDGLVTLGAGFNLWANRSFGLFVSAEAGGYIGSSDRETTIGDQTVNEVTDTNGVAVGGALELSYLIGRSKRAQLRGGVRYLGLIGSETVESTDQELDVTTNTVGLSVGFMYYF